MTHISDAPQPQPYRPPPTARQLVVVTGLSGAGKHTALLALEDAGFFAADNVPPPLWPALFGTLAPNHLHVALGIDIRTQPYLPTLHTILQTLSTHSTNAANSTSSVVHHITCMVVFLEADDATLINRYSLTRRVHPLNRASLSADIAQERQTLRPVRALADRIIDTSNLAPKDLQVLLQTQFARDMLGSFQVRLMSFGFKRGVPVDSDTVCDVRMMPNPFYAPTLRAADGRQKAVQDYVFSNFAGPGEDFYQTLQAYLLQLIQKAQASGRKTYAIAIGCTGGQHRSVAVVERLTQDLTQALNTTTPTQTSKDTAKDANTYHFHPTHRDVAVALAEHQIAEH